MCIRDRPFVCFIFLSFTFYTIFFIRIEKFSELFPRAKDVYKRQVVNIYSDNNAYANLFKTDFG